MKADILVKKCACVVFLLYVTACTGNQMRRIPLNLYFGMSEQEARSELGSKGFGSGPCQHNRALRSPQRMALETEVYFGPTLGSETYDVVILEYMTSIDGGPDRLNRWARISWKSKEGIPNEKIEDSLWRQSRQIRIDPSVASPGKSDGSSDSW